MGRGGGRVGGRGGGRGGRIRNDGSAEICSGRVDGEEDGEREERDEVIRE